MGQTTGGKEKQLARQPLLRNSAEHLMLMLIGMRQSRWGGACRGVLGFAPTVRGARGGGEEEGVDFHVWVLIPANPDARRHQNWPILQRRFVSFTQMWHLSDRVILLHVCCGWGGLSNGLAYQEGSPRAPCISSGAFSWTGPWWFKSLGFLWSV